MIHHLSHLMYSDDFRFLSTLFEKKRECFFISSALMRVLQGDLICLPHSRPGSLGNGATRAP
jgi:hypothetical protein